MRSFSVGVTCFFHLYKKNLPSHMQGLKTRRRQKNTNRTARKDGKNMHTNEGTARERPNKAHKARTQKKKLLLSMGHPGCLIGILIIYGLL